MQLFLKESELVLGGEKLMNREGEVMYIDIQFKRYFYRYKINFKDKQRRYFVILCDLKIQKDISLFKIIIFLSYQLWFYLYEFVQQIFF